MFDRIKAHAWWSIYVKTSSEEELRAAHLPLIASALESIDFDWNISVEAESPGLIRLVNCQNLDGASVENVVVPVLRRAYRLTNEWRIAGLEALASGQLKHVQGDSDIRVPSNSPPSLVSLVFAIKPSHIRRPSREEAAAAGWTTGAWRLVE